MNKLRKAGGYVCFAMVVILLLGLLAYAIGDAEMALKAIVFITVETVLTIAGFRLLFW